MAALTSDQVTLVYSAGAEAGCARRLPRSWASGDGRKTGRIHAARSAQGPGFGFRPGCSGINRELRCPVK